MRDPNDWYGSGDGWRGRDGHGNGWQHHNGRGDQGHADQGWLRGANLSATKAGLNDLNIASWLGEFGDGILDGMPADRQLADLDFSRNALTDEGAATLVSWLIDNHVSTTRLRLFTNRLVRCEAICRYLEDLNLGAGAPRGVRELHLSTNLINHEGIANLLEALLWSKISRDLEVFDPPIWLRVERNIPGLSETDAINFQDGYGKKGLALCLEGGMGGECSVKRCAHGADVHIHFIGSNQSSNWRA